MSYTYALNVGYLRHRRKRPRLRGRQSQRKKLT